MTDHQSSPESVQRLFECHVNDGNIEELVRLYEPNGIVIQSELNIEFNKLC
jgi:hypothetical protein